MFDRRQFLATLSALSLAGFGSARAAEASGTLMLYTSQPEKDARGTIDAFNKVHPGVKVEVFRSGTTEVISRLRTEISAGAPQADVLLIADAVNMEALAAEGRLAKLPMLAGSAVPARFQDPEGFYVGTKVITSGLVVRNDCGVKPTAWKDLIRPELKGKVILPSPLYSGASAITVGTWARHPDLGWDFVKALKDNGAIAVKGNGAVLTAVANGERKVGVLVDFMAFNAAAKGSPVQFSVPAEGLTFVSEPTAILSTAKNKAAAEAFVSFLISEAGQQFAVSQGYYPALSTVTPPQGYQDMGSLKFMDLDLPALLAGAKADLERFTEIFGG